MKINHAAAIYPVVKHGKLIADAYFEMLRDGVISDCALVVHGVSSCSVPDCPSASGPDDRRIVDARNTPPSSNAITPVTEKAAANPACEAMGWIAIGERNCPRNTAVVK